MAKIFLLGFMGSGKSTIGSALAKKMSYNFIDLDDLIVQNSGLAIPVIFDKKGEPYFRQIESASLKSLAAVSHTIVALGGGTPCFFDNMQWINQHGVSVYLATSTDVLVERLKKETAQRPLLQSLSAARLPTYIEEKLAERTPFYQQAHLHYFTTTGCEPIVDELYHFFKQMAKK